jgi:UDP-hydrolysing UDP-N-acetyl-D-glucosamine 2-epimerase
MAGMREKVLYISGTRADYGLMRSVLREINKDPEFDLGIIATGMHLMSEFGMTVNEIRTDGFTVYESPVLFNDDTPAAVAFFIGDLIGELTRFVTSNRPDMILLLGDRSEMLAGAIVGTYLRIPVVHIHGGEVTSTVDEHVRHAITKLSHIHLAATERSARRIIRMGENPEHVHVVGAPGLDAILSERLIETEDIAFKYGLDLKKPVILLVQHPVSNEYESAGRQMQETMDAILKHEVQTIIIYPNADAGGRKIISTIQKNRNRPGIQTHKSIPHLDYLSLLRISSALVGNSSSGIIEAPSFGLPVVNIGSRQEGRERADNIIDVPYDQREISKAIAKALHDPAFIQKAKTCKNPYGDGRAAKKIIPLLKRVSPQAALVQKKFRE